MHARTALFALVSLALLLVAASGTASAHKTAYSADGKVRIVWGFLNEPAVTYTKTGIDLQLRDNATGAPIEGADKTVNASLVLGDQAHAFDGLAPQHGADKKGYYTDIVTLTRPGLYGLRLVGTIDGTPVDMTIPAQHEVNDVGATYFPDAMGPGQLAGEVTKLRQELDALKAQVQTQTGTPADVTPQGGNGVPAPGLLASLAVVGVAAVLLMRRRA